MKREINNTIYKRDDIITDLADTKIIEKHLLNTFIPIISTAWWKGYIPWETQSTKPHRRDSQILCCLLKT